MRRAAPAGFPPPAAGLWLTLAVIATTILGCERKPPASAPPTDPAARSQALIEAGNQSYRARDYALAARRYAAAAVVKKDDPAAYYGLGMALSKLGRDEDARKAYARARELAHQQQQP